MNYDPDVKEFVALQNELHEANERIATMTTELELVCGSRELWKANYNTLADNNTTLREENTKLRQIIDEDKTDVPALQEEITHLREGLERIKGRGE